MEDLVTWLRQQIDEDERVAKKAGKAMGFDDPCFPDYRTYDGWELQAADAFILHLSPARVLREVESKRRILDLVAKTREWTNGAAGATAGYAAVVVGDTVRLLALPYADREGFRDEWRP